MLGWPERTLLGTVTWGVDQSAYSDEGHSLEKDSMSFLYLTRASKTPIVEESHFHALIDAKQLSRAITEAK